MSCVIRGCTSHTGRKQNVQEPLTFHRFPKDEDIKKKWLQHIKKRNWTWKIHSRVCSRHFTPESFMPNEKFKWRRLREDAFPTLYLSDTESLSKDVTSPAISSTRAPTVGTYVRNSSNIKQRKLQVTEQDAQPGPSQILDTRTPIDSGARPQDPLIQVVQQCRFCGEFSKDCVAVSSDMTYLASNKTTLALNDTSVQLDFNDRSLPKTVCRDCDAKLQEFCDFVKVVKAAQCTLINVAEEKAEFEETTADFEESTAKCEEIEILVVKTEDSDGEEGIVDPLDVGETIFVNKTHKRKSDKDTTKPKKLKAKEKCDDDFVIAIKEEVVENDTNEQFEVSDTGTDVKPSKLELATSALVFKMAGDGTSKYQGYRSDI